MDFLWKTVTVVINCCIRAAVHFHNIPHGLRVVQGYVTASLESKLLNKLISIRYEVLYKVFLDLRNAYNSIYHKPCMKILVGYGMGPQVERLLHTYWGQITMVAQVGCYYGTHFKVYMGVIQGNPLYPTIFNMVVDTVIRHWVALVEGKEAGPEVLGIAFQMLNLLFYTDNVILASPRLSRI